jgi:hypothetical protein
MMDLLHALCRSTYGGRLHPTKADHDAAQNDETSIGLSVTSLGRCDDADGADLSAALAFGCQRLMSHAAVSDRNSRSFLTFSPGE